MRAPPAVLASAFLFGLAGAPSADHPAPPPAPDGEARFDSDAALSPHALDVASYTLRASLDPDAHTIHGEGTITWRNTSSVAVRELWVHLYLNAFKNERSAWLRAPAGFRGTSRRGEPGSIDVRRFALQGGAGGATELWPGAELHRPGDEDETDARVPLPRDVAPGEAIAIDVAWDDRLPELVARTGYVERFHMVAQWFPKIARLEPDGVWAHFPFYHLAEFYADYGRYDVTLDVPRAFVLGATGEVAEARIDGGRRVERYVQGDVHDFAWTAWDEWRVETEEIDGVRVRVLHPPGYEAAALRQLRALRFALPWLGARFGAYPYAGLTVVLPPGWHAAEAGGMEYPTLITTGATWYPKPGFLADEATLVHELCHQWFYGLVATSEVEWPFLDEGLASYAGDMTMRAWVGVGSEVDLFGFQVDGIEEGAASSSALAHDAPVAQPAYAFDPPSDLSGLVYGRTAAIFETLGRVYGDALALGAVGRYARRFRFQHPGPEELLGVLGDVMGEKAQRAARAALFDEAWVDYAVVAIDDRSVVVHRRGTLSFPVEVELVSEDGARRRVHWDGESGVIRIPYVADVGGAPLHAAVVDPDHKVLLDEDPSNDFATVDGQKGGAPRTLERVLYWAELAMQALL